MRHNLSVERSHTSIGEIKCIYTRLNGLRIDPIVLVVRNLSILAYARTRHRKHINIRYLWKNYVTKVGARQMTSEMWPHSQSQK